LFGRQIPSFDRCLSEHRRPRQTGAHPVETPFLSADKSVGMDTNTLIIVSVLALILAFIFFVYLLLRRTAQGFKEGMEGE
jgi:hypothetical protein